jgi:drug/metabolite transporter (DMT)-like permease
MLPRRGDFARLALCALLGIVLNQVLALEGIARTSVVHAGLLMTLIPVFTYALATLVGQERLRGERIFGIALAMGGAATLVLWRAGPAQPGEDPLLGNVLIVANCLSYAGFLVLARPLLTRIAPLALIGWVFLLSLWTVPLVGAGVELLPEGLTTRAWWGMAYTLVFPTAVAYLLNTLALARLPASTTAVFIYLQPIFAGASGVLWRGETVGPASIGAALLLFAGIWFVVRRRPPSRAPVRAAEEPRA